MSRFVERRPVEGASGLEYAKDADHGGAACAMRVFVLTPARAAALRMRVRETAKLHHPALARLVALGEEDGHPVVVRQWIEGSAMQAPMAAPVAIEAVVRVLDALELAHWHDLTHGGIRPECVIMGPQGAVLVDLAHEGLGTVQGDLRGVADLLEAVVPDLPASAQAVVAQAHAGAYPSARELQQALLALIPHRAVSRPSGAGAWPQRALWGALGVPLVVAVAWVAMGASGGEREGEGLERLELASSAPPEEPASEAPSTPGPSGPVPSEDAGSASPLAPLASAGKWMVERLGGPEAGVTLWLAAENDVADRMGRSGRPMMELRCEKGELQPRLHAAVQALERLDTQNGVESTIVIVHASGPTSSDKLKLKVMEGRSVLTFPGRSGKWLEANALAGQLAFAYVPFASEAVEATFDWTGFEQALAAFPAGCAF